MKLISISLFCVCLLGCVSQTNKVSLSIKPNTNLTQCRDLDQTKDAILDATIKVTFSCEF